MFGFQLVHVACFGIFRRSANNLHKTNHDLHGHSSRSGHIGSVSHLPLVYSSESFMVVCVHSEVFDRQSEGVVVTVNMNSVYTFCRGGNRLK